MAKTPIQTREIDQGLAERLDNVVESSYIDVPNTVISNRAKIRDPASDLRPRLGVERLQASELELVDDEVGPNGKLVQKYSTDLFDTVRFVGSWYEQYDSSGKRIVSLDSGNFFEITFYGTGINVNHNANGTQSFFVSVDGGGEIDKTTPNELGVLVARNYNTNQVYNLSSGLSLGLHTIKVRCANFALYGFEILNESAQLTTTPGAAYKGTDRRDSTLDVQSYSSGFTVEEGVTGTKGGHVNIYQDKDGSIQKAIQWTEISQLNVGAANHLNEELIKKHTFRSFGAGRADDFSSLSGTPANIGFTADDGTTTLSGLNVQSFLSGDHEVISPNGIGNYIIFTFVGTGLDILSAHTDNPDNAWDIFVDGISIQSSGPITQSSIGLNTYPIVSGLPYGTHTVKIEKQGSSGSGIHSFLVYGPKKPTLPDDAIELGDYFLMADYDSSGTTGTTIDDRVQIPNGVLTKSTLRELIYEGSGWITDISVTDPGAANVYTVTATDKLSYTFWGTGFQTSIAGSSAGNHDFTIKIDNVLNDSGVAVVNGSNLGSGSYRSTGGTGEPVRIDITGLSLQLHTVTIERTAGPGTFGLGSFHIITPIHTSSFDSEITKQQIVGTSGGGIRDQRQLTAKPTLKTRAQQIEDGEIQFTHDLSGAKILSGTTNIPRAVFIPYKTASGVWRMRINLASSTASATTGQIAIAGVKFKTAVDFFQPLTMHTNVSDWSKAYTFYGQDYLVWDTGVASIRARISGDVELDHKPTWAV